MDVLPEGWTTAALDASLVAVTSGFACSKSKLVPSGIAHLRPFNVSSNGELDLTTIYYMPGDLIDDIGSYSLESGDILFNNTNSVELVGKSAIVREPLLCAFSNHITRIRVVDKERLDPRWLLLCLRNLWMQGFFAKNCNRWIGQAGFNNSKLAEVMIPLPPLETQRRIVARLDALLAEVAEARRLHAEIAADTDHLLVAALRTSFDDLSVNAPSARLGDRTIAEVFPGQHVMSADYSSAPPGTPYITGPADFGEKFPLVSKWTAKPTVMSKPGDVLFTVKGSGVGKVNVAPPNEPICIGRQVMAIRPNQDCLLTDFLFFALLGRFDEFQALRQGAAIPGIRKEHVESIEIPLPPRNLQLQVISYLEAVQDEVSEMQRTQAEEARMLDEIEQALLRQAFRGEL